MIPRAGHTGQPPGRRSVLVASERVEDHGWGRLRNYPRSSKARRMTIVLVNDLEYRNRSVGCGDGDRNVAATQAPICVTMRKNMLAERVPSLLSLSQRPTCATPERGKCSSLDPPTSLEVPQGFESFESSSLRPSLHCSRAFM